jgi:hypothetical protein
VFALLPHSRSKSDFPQNGNKTGLPNITTSGMSFFGNGTACDNITGWYAIDDITLVGSTVTALDLRFEQHCEGKDPALHGKIHYSQ